MMLQIQQITAQNQLKAGLQAAQEDYNKLLQTLLSCLKAKIRSDITEGKFTTVIEGDCEISNSPNIQCNTIPQFESPSELFSYRTIDGSNYFCWNEICHGENDGKRFASKNICVELTAAGKRLLDDLKSVAYEDGIQLEFQPVLDMQNGKFILPKFGQFENVPALKRGKKGTLNGYFVNLHYKLL